MSGEDSNLDRLLKARAAIDDELRRQKSVRTVLFTDVVGSTAYFDRYGDTAGLALVQRHAELGAQAVAELGGKVIKTIGDSVMAVFDEPVAAVRAACRIQRRVYDLNTKLSLREQHQLRIGVNHGPVYCDGNDVFGDAVNVAARICKHTGPAQILISHSVYESLGSESDLPCQSIGKLAFAGKTDSQDIFEVVWIDRATYTRLREHLTERVTPAPNATPATAGDESGASPAPLPGPFLESPALRARFEIVSEIGRGGMGIVYKAHDRETGEIVALKILRPELAADPVAIERFKKELRLARKITHKNVCRIYDFHGSDSAACFSMEYVEGESLRRTLNRFRTLSVPQGTDIARQICAGLREAHSQGIIHRDLKPENIMIDEAGKVKLMDFGIARLADSSNLSTTGPMGTPAYMAPEQVESQPLSPATDIYALGLILFEMFTGAQAFVGDTPIAVAIKQLQEVPRLPQKGDDSLPPYLEKVILKCLEKKAAQRFQSAEDLEAAMTRETKTGQGGAGAQLVPRLVPAVEDTRSPDRISRLPSSQPWRKVAWAALGVLLIAAGWIAVARRPFPPPSALPSGLTPPPSPPTQSAPQPSASEEAVPKSVAPMRAEQGQPGTNAEAPSVRPPARAPSVQPRVAEPTPAAPHSAEIQRLLALARQATAENRQEEALAAFKNVLALDPNNNQAAAGAAILKGRQLQAAGDNDGAVRMFEEALTRLPGDPRIRQVLDRARRVQALEQRSQRRFRRSP